MSGVQYEVYIQYQPDIKAKLDIVYFQCNQFSGWSVFNSILARQRKLSCSVIPKPTSIVRYIIFCRQDRQFFEQQLCAASLLVISIYRETVETLIILFRVSIFFLEIFIYKFHQSSSQSNKQLVDSIRQNSTIGTDAIVSNMAKKAGNSSIVGASRACTNDRSIIRRECGQTLARVRVSQTQIDR